MRFSKSFSIFVATAVASTFFLGGTAAQASPGDPRAQLGPCNSPQAIKFSNSGINGGTSTIQNCFTSKKRVAMRIHNVVGLIGWDQNGSCVTLNPGAKTSMRNATTSYGFGWVSC
ncbi:hypothetical protein EDF31_101523 [Curtobacterium sp. PhB142]|uniref:hypothetical protein n=1 Tax=unclassified Curtobacterium TaxID=257496 RepID=UPI000F4F772D|nr:MULTISPECIES: hypothetical protein [unclassified Curtobacterium]RPE84658.1 hypothetical protein EDF28_0590 [Curtobacterium sp. PhB137]TCL88676.1 hypothetical protein EDF31_101523 [Curtobacterium sp. PhB142]TCM03961.1 hypothetical protein EDF26_102171 [Curtobacterium sp. PhB134]